MKLGVGDREIISMSDGLVFDLVTPPSSHRGICLACRTWLPTTLVVASPVEQRLECENCREVRDALGVAPLAISVVSLYRKPSQLRDWLTRYKGREDDLDPLDHSHVEIVRSIVGRFVVEHGERLEKLTGRLDGIVVVPSTNRPPPHPLEAVLASLHLDVPLLRLLERGSGDLGFRTPHPDGYRVATKLPPSRLLLVDDVYTTGSRLNSAAFALRASGHAVGAALVLARRINPDYTPEAASLWEQATTSGFSWEESPWIPN